jgi:hypothetical protein
METNKATEAKTDRKMWFSMWFLGAIASFGAAFFPFFYYSVDRRNHHFQRQAEFEQKVAAFAHKDWKTATMPKRNAKLWAASIILIVPVFALAYFLSKDLNEHEKRQYDFLKTFYPERKYTAQWVFIRNCALITVATLGFGVVYWLYKIVNLYNNHFKEQYHIEHELTELMERQSHVQPV